MASFAITAAATRVASSSTSARNVYGRGVPGSNYGKNHHDFAPSRSDYRRRASGDIHSMGSCTTCAVGLFSAGLIVGGASMLIASLQNDRHEKVGKNNDAVVQWTAQFRQEMINSRFNVTVRWRNSLEGNVDNDPEQQSHGTLLEPMTAQDVRWEASDSENGMGVLDYSPLKFIAQVEMPSYYSTEFPGRPQTEPLPSRGNAPTIDFEFSALGPGQGRSPSLFKTNSFPLVFDEIVPPMTPAPETKCRSNQHGWWHHNRCHVVRRLKTLCAQIHLNATGAWGLKYATRDMATSSKLGTATADATIEPYGCDPRKKWAPAIYEVDPCWGPRPPRRCGKDERRHLIEVMIRSAHDPYIIAEVLTDDTFDFGLDPSTQAGIAAVLLAMGALLSLPVLLRTIRCRKVSSRSEELAALSPSATCVGSGQL